MENLAKSLLPGGIKPSKKEYKKEDQIESDPMSEEYRLSLMPQFEAPSSHALVESHERSLLRTKDMV